MKPSLGKKVYVIYQKEIYLEEVGYVGQESWIVNDFSDLRKFDSLEYFFDEYETTWFSSLALAKKKLLAQLNLDSEKYVIRQTSNEVWSVEKRQ